MKLLRKALGLALTTLPFTFLAIFYYTTGGRDALIIFLFNTLTTGVLTILIAVGVVLLES